MKVFISGQKYFGGEVFRLCMELGLEIVGVCCPFDDKHIGRLATGFNIPRIPSGSLRADVFPEGVDLGITAHSFDYIGKATRYKPKYGWIGYHPSLLPRHRGRSSIEWAIRMGDPITGGTIFWLDQGIDRGDIAYQDWIFIDPKYKAYENPKKAAAELWEKHLQGIGIKLFREALTDIEKGVIKRLPQQKEFSTFEPSTEVCDIYRPDALMLPEAKIKKEEQNV